MKKKIYVACALTHAPEEFREGIEQLKGWLRKDHDILDFMGVKNGTPEEIFTHDLGCVRRCDLVVADCTHPSIGLGMELGVAIERDKPILVVAKNGAKVSNIVFGITHPKFSLKQYQDSSEVVEFVKEKILSL